MILIGRSGQDCARPGDTASMALTQVMTARIRRTLYIVSPATDPGAQPRRTINQPVDTRPGKGQEMRPAPGEYEAGRARDAGRRAARWKDSANQGFGRFTHQL